MKSEVIPIIAIPVIVLLLLTPFIEILNKPIKRMINRASTTPIIKRRGKRVQNKEGQFERR